LCTEKDVEVDNVLAVDTDHVEEKADALVFNFKKIISKYRALLLEDTP
jgi:hypothetical protein